MTQWQRVSKAHPCPVCGKPDWCAVAKNGATAYCMRVPSNRKSRSQAGGYIHQLNDDSQHPIASLERAKPKPNDTALHVELEPVAKRALGDALHTEKLAGLLGVTQKSLELLEVGWDNVQGSWCWTWPERNALGQIVGITLRYPNDKKRMVKGSRRGLYYEPRWCAGRGPLYIVEGGSDTAAMLSMGLRAVGRPQAMPGRQAMRDLATLLPTSRGPIVVLGERDRKRHQDLPPATQACHRPSCRGCELCWPGRHGAIETARKLRSRLHRRKVMWRLPPDDAKDARAWLRAQDCDPLEAGKRFMGGTK
jgi:hypothetical protein